MYPRAFAYHRAKSYAEAVSRLSELGEDAKFLAGGQSLIPLMKLRLSAPRHLVDLNFIPETSYIRGNGGLPAQGVEAGEASGTAALPAQGAQERRSPGTAALRLGAMTRHSEIAASAEVARPRLAILHDCAAGIADPQVRHMGTIGGSIAEADPTGDWAPVLLATGATVKVLGPAGERTIEIGEFILDAYTTALEAAEVVTEIAVPLPAAGRSGGAYVALKRCAPVYASASVAVQLALDDDGRCREARVYLGVLGLTATRVEAAEEALRGQAMEGALMARAREAVMEVAQPAGDMRGSAEYKRQAAGALAKLAVEAAWRRARGEQVEVTHLYA